MIKIIAMMIVATLWSGAAFAGAEEQSQVAIARAASAVEAAENADAATLASTMMGIARDHLTAARGAAERESWETAVMAAEKAQADASLAGARARKARAADATAELEASIEALRRQIALPEGPS